MERHAQHAEEIIMTRSARNPAISEQRVLVMEDVHQLRSAYVWMDGEEITVQFVMIPHLARNARSGVT
jgi:hypothetical protein